MGQLISETLNLDRIVSREVELYAGETHEAQIYPVLDDTSRTYAVVLVPEKSDLRPAWVLLMARVVGDRVLILEDTALDKPLVDALMVNGGIPREKIVLAYKGEKMPAALATSSDINSQKP